MSSRARVDKVRASRDGHEYHEAWTARKALQLLWPDTDLVAIAVEGLSPTDQARASAQTIEIADITLYYGGRPTFEEASRTSIAQFKYSVADNDKGFRASHAKKTIRKFGATYRDFIKKYGADAVQNKLDFQLITNQPIYEPLLLAIDAIAQGLPRTGEIEKQAKQFETAAGLDGAPLAAFAAKCTVLGRCGSLRVTKDELANLLVDWSATNDPIAAARLGQLKDLVREKAGYAGTNQNLITRPDILARLRIGDPDDLLPCKPALTDVGAVVEREQLADAVALIPSLSVPLLVHGVGGVGKTVFMSSLAARLVDHHEVLFFDCFGGGAYRSLEDARHLPQNGLIHIANTLAFRGLCDPMLPDSTDARTLMRTFKRRLIQCIDTISRTTPGRELALFIDAIDNADIAARQRSEDSFPVKLLESLDTKPIPGLKLIVSCRTEHKPSTYAKYVELELRPFSRPETTEFLRARMSNVSQVEINVAQARSGGNPRVLNYLLMSDRGLLDESEIDKKIVLDELIQNRITDALATVIERGYEQTSINAFLAGLAVLPPPVPLDEYACALGIGLSAVLSFVADLFPLLERSNQGLMFRDEPTETLVRRNYASSAQPLRRLAENLLARQDVSVYAARALPGLLHQLDDGERLFALAFDDRIPASITSTVGKRNIRYARLKAATLHAAMKKDPDRLVQLLLELSTIAVVDQRGAAYILDHPDLVMAARDVDATRRLFETRTSWPGARHARLAIANALSGEFEEAYRHVSAAKEWIDHYRRTDRDSRRLDPGPERPDIAAIPFFLITEGCVQNAARFLEGWRDWYAYEVCEYVFDYSRLAQATGSQSPRRLSRFVGELTRIGPLAAALSFREFRRPKRTELIGKLARLCRKRTKLHVSEPYQRHTTYQLQDGLRKAAAMALTLGLDAEALAISARAPHERPGIWSFRDVFYHHDVFPFVFRTALVAAVKRSSLHEKDVLPKELAPICASIRKTLTGKAFRNKAKERLSKYPRKQRNEDEEERRPHALSYEARQAAERFIDQCLEPLLALTKALSAILAASSRSVDKAFMGLLEVWEDARRTREPYRRGEINHFFQMLGLDAALFAFWVRSKLKLASAESFLNTVHSQYIGVHNLVQIVSILAKRPPLHDLAGAQALKARTLIEAEHDVTYRASLFASLGRAMLPASIDEASVYFRNGLEQMDAIGSGDYQFTNELLLFTSTIKGDELDERDFHTLSNICELNIGEEPEKFFWGAYGRGLSRAAGPRGLAKLSRWDDRSRAPLSNTLLPYLTALVGDGKIESKDALALNHLANPVEYFQYGTEHFAAAIRDKAGPDPAVISELIQQFEDNNPGIPMDSTVEALGSLAKEALGPSSETATYLSAACKRYASVRDTRNEHRNYRGAPDVQMQERANEKDRENRAALERIANATDPRDETSLGRAISDLNDLQHVYEFKGDFFAALRAKLRFPERAKYIRDICALEHFSLYWKLAELKECKKAWAGSSAALDEVYRSEAVPLINLHADDLVDGSTLSSSQIKEISYLTGVPGADLILELITVATRPNKSVAGAVWLAFSSFICPQAKDGQGQRALRRLLRGDTAKLADNVANGVWAHRLYPKDDIPTIASGLVWRALGSPCAENRWRAAHSIRCFAGFGRWEVVDSLVRHLNSRDAGPFQAPELAFYYMHARLWLVIALARVALDHPKEIARFKDALLPIAVEHTDPHVLMRHFAAKALLSCIEAGELKLPVGEEKVIRAADLSPHPRLRKKIEKRDDSYHGRPDSIPKPDFEFHFDYDFHKYDVDSLSHVFGKSCWEVADMISTVVHQLDPGVSSMYESGGRESRYGPASHEISTRHHTYGQQLGWHALFIAAGKLLEAFPVTDDWGYEDDPWGEWLGRYVLTQDDGLWLSDGTDRKPLDTVEILLEKREKDLAITGDSDILLRLAGLTSCVGKELVVEGRWFSADDIEVHISSALVPPDRATHLARKLTSEEPMVVWIPFFNDVEDDLEHLREDKREYIPWVVRPSGVAQLDEHDPYGVSCANLRPRLARDFSASCSLTSDDPFGRMWEASQGRSALRAQAWGRKDKDSEEGPHSGLRLLCKSSVLKRILAKYDKELLLLIKLQRYEKGYRGDSKWTHTIAVVRITKTLDLEYFKGRINHLHESRY
ncbi:NACHT domain-containing protein [Candidatus Bipolaricaulota bacterium]|nr:NACHT domain-containing protein [Candidatus Bipolaricaulota bacterium]